MAKALPISRAAFAFFHFYMAMFAKLASAIMNDVVSGLRGYHHNMSMSIEQLEDEIVEERLQVIKEYSLKGILPIRDLLLAINCIDVDCKDLDRCKCSSYTGRPVAHFEIPQVVNDYGDMAIDYIGSTDRQFPFVFYTSSYVWNFYHKYRKRGKQKPFVFIDTTPNENGMYDCFLFNAPMMKQISVVAVFKDPRQLENYGCCSDLADHNFSFIDNEVKRRLIEKKVRYYRQLAAPILPNDQEYAAG